MVGKSKYRIDLEVCDNPKCSQCTNKQDRGPNIDNDLCRTAPSVLDGRPVRCVGSWGYDKIYYLVQYFGIFSIGTDLRRNIRNVILDSSYGRVKNKYSQFIGDDTFFDSDIMINTDVRFKTPKGFGFLA